jgi:hypothetical protein
MTDSPHAPDIIDDGASDVLAEDEVVHVAPGDAELAESIQHRHEASGSSRTCRPGTRKIHCPDGRRVEKPGR